MRCRTSGAVTVDGMRSWAQKALGPGREWRLALTLLLFD